MLYQLSYQIKHPFFKGSAKIRQKAIASNYLREVFPQFTLIVGQFLCKQPQNSPIFVNIFL
jgi:hypothetical protein